MLLECRGRADHLQSKATNKLLRQGSGRASSLVEAVAEEETEPSDSFSFGKGGEDPEKLVACSLLSIDRSILNEKS